MQIKCPGCNAQFSLDAALGVDAARSALLAALAMPAPLAGLLAQYLGLFRAAGRALAFDRVERLLAELQPMLAQERVERAGSTRVCPLAIWQAAFETVIEHRNAQKLRLPLKTHGYLLEIAFALADKQEAAVEQRTEADRRRGVAREAAPAPDVERSWFINNVRGDLSIGLIDRAQAEAMLQSKGIRPEVLDER